MLISKAHTFYWVFLLRIHCTRNFTAECFVSWHLLYKDMTKLFSEHPLFYNYGFLLLYITTPVHVMSSCYAVYSGILFASSLGRLPFFQISIGFTGKLVWAKAAGQLWCLSCAQMCSPSKGFFSLPPVKSNSYHRTALAEPQSVIDGNVFPATTWSLRPVDLSGQ